MVWCRTGVTNLIKVKVTKKKNAKSRRAKKEKKHRNWIARIRARASLRCGPKEFWEIVNMLKWITKVFYTLVFCCIHSSVYTMTNVLSFYENSISLLSFSLAMRKNQQQNKRKGKKTLKKPGERWLQGN